MCGNVRQWNGEATLLADVDRGGIVGCQEGLDVLAEYLMFAPDKGSELFQELDFNGWKYLSKGPNIQCSNSVRGISLHTQK